VSHTAALLLNKVDSTKGIRVRSLESANKHLTCAVSVAFVTTLILLAVLLQRLVLKLQGRDLSSIAEQHKLNNKLCIPDARVRSGGCAHCMCNAPVPGSVRQQKPNPRQLATASKDAMRCSVGEWLHSQDQVLQSLTSLHARSSKLNCWPVTVTVTGGVLPRFARNFGTRTSTLSCCLTGEMRIQELKLPT
jgi:hypothetical protein